MWDLPGPGLEPMSPALAGGFLTTAPRGKSWPAFFLLLTVKLRGKKETEGRTVKHNGTWTWFWKFPGYSDYKETLKLGDSL